MVVCSVCEDHWPSARLEEHSELCAVLQQLSTSGLSVDGMLTTLANVIEEQVRHERGYLFLQWVNNLNLQIVWQAVEVEGKGYCAVFIRLSKALP